MPDIRKSAVTPYIYDTYLFIFAFYDTLLRVLQNFLAVWNGDYDLVPADKKQRLIGAPLKAVNYEDGDIKHQIANIIKLIAQGYHFQSLKEYKALLSFHHVNMEEVRGEVKGKPYKELVYSALNNKNEKVGNPFKSSLFGKSDGLDALEKRLEKSAEIIKDKGLKERSKKVITSAMQSCRSEGEFRAELKKNGGDVLFRANDTGRIYGATFIDHERKPYSTVRVWVKSFRRMCSTIYSMGSNPNARNISLKMIRDKRLRINRATIRLQAVYSLCFHPKAMV